MFSKIMFACVLTALAATGLAAPASDQKDRDAQIKLALDELKNEVVVLERQVRDMQASMDRNSGQMNALINQIVDNVNAIRQAQSRVAASLLRFVTFRRVVGARVALHCCVGAT